MDLAVPVVFKPDTLKPNISKCYNTACLLLTVIYNILPLLPARALEDYLKGDANKRG
jgi:hypothetical protein